MSVIAVLYWSVAVVSDVFLLAMFVVSFSFFSGGIVS